MPLQRRIPKRGFKNINRVEYRTFNLDQLQELCEKHAWTSISIEELRKQSLIARKDKVKILGRGELKTKVEVSVNAFSETAKKAIEDLGGTATTI
jgi:large subunit ribosomal protein L15